ncbi:hypothetical protein ACH0B6_20735 [Solibacillus silvestris]
MSVAKSFRLSDFSNALLEEISKRKEKTQTDVIEELIEGYVIFDLTPEESSEIMKAAKKRMNTIKSEGK